MRKLILVTIAFAFTAIALAGPFEIGTASNDHVRLDWESIPGKKYNVLASPSLAPATWTNVTPVGVTPSNVLGVSTVPMGGDTYFYRVDKEDIDPPSIEWMVPAQGAISVVSNATVYIAFQDETGIDSNSIILGIGPWTNLSLPNPLLTYSNMSLIFTPTSALGEAGGVISNSLTVPDTLGNTLSNYTWTFQLARPSVVTSTFLSLTAPPSEATTRDGMLRSLATVTPREGEPELHIESVTSNTVVFSYTGGPPEITNGTLLVSFDAAHPFYRKVTSNLVNEVGLVITAWTIDIPITDLIESGSFSAGDFTSTDPAMAHKLTSEVELNLLHVEFGTNYNGTELFTNDDVTVWLPECSWSFTGDVNVAAGITWNGLESFDASAQGVLTIHLKPEVLFDRATSGGDEIMLAGPYSHIFGGMAGPVPVWIEVRMQLNAGYSYGASIEGNAHTVVDTARELTFYVQLRDNEWTEGCINEWRVLEAEPIVWNVEGHAEAQVYLRPTLTILAYSVAGVWADIKPYVEFEGDCQLNPLEYDMGLYFGISSSLGVEVFWIPVASWPLYDQRWPLWTTNYPSPTAMPVFADSFPNRGFQVGHSLTLAAWASGIPEPQYRWYYEGSRIVGQTSPEYRILSASEGYAGIYTVEAYNSAGSVQTSCTLTVTSSSGHPAGMIIIPAGSFSMGDSFNEGGSDDELPVHSVYLNAFYMDQCEVTKGLWDKVANWAQTNGYDISASSASGKATNHPAYSVTWYESVKWCNARSEKEGLTPAYYISSTRTSVYRTGNLNIQNDWVRWDTGYRLPTEAEWEKAARGGAANHRFPWSDTDTIQHNRANYYSTSFFSYDTSPTRLYHPDYEHGGTPYTSPAGSFPANGYGLYDMAGNVWEWCWDGYESDYYSSSPGTDPRGPSSGTERVLRGCDWNNGYGAGYCRTASRSKTTPTDAGSGPSHGFRCVR